LNLEPVLHLGPIFKFPETTERPGHFVGYIVNAGDKLTFKILKNDLSAILHVRVVRSTVDADHQNVLL
jgi:hypothetical protein